MVGQRGYSLMKITRKGFAELPVAVLLDDLRSLGGRLCDR
jgi:hypothetical protein